MIFCSFCSRAASSERQEKATSVVSRSFSRDWIFSRSSPSSLRAISHNMVISL